MSRIILITAAVLAGLLVISSSFYIYWSVAPPTRTCNTCHEINNSYDTWLLSAHRNISCSECHGTALSNGFHSIAEKAGMVRTHFREQYVEELRLSEEQVLESMESCIRCHQDAWSDWLAGGHSATYQSIFLNTAQNSKEQLNYDCLRCHGMFFGGSIDDLAEPISLTGPWKLKDTLKNDQPVLPCMSCHQMHSPGYPAVRQDYSLPSVMEYNRPPWNSSLSLYLRPEKMYFHVSVLPTPEIYFQDTAIRVSDDSRQRLCMQCHAPQANHLSGSSDDRTPRGVHEGLSCLSCHEPHNNDTKSSCKLCHPALSNCGLDVEKMNTSFAVPGSANNIHFVSCADCHGTN
jgi:hypothetical protein